MDTPVSPNVTKDISYNRLESAYSLDINQDNDLNDQAVEFEIARQEALRDAEIAFQSIDTNKNGKIDYSEALKFIQNSASQNDFAGNDAKARAEAFYKSYDEDGDQSISKAEWLTFYGKLFDEIIKSGLSHSSQTLNQQQ